MKDQREMVHLLYRAGFGPSQKDIQEFSGLPYSDVVEKLFIKSESFTPLILRIREPIKGEKSVKGTKAIKRKNRNAKINLNYRWLMQMAQGKEQLREKMAFFWHDHFPVNISSPKFSASYLNVIRQHALGSFEILLTEISKDASMLTYLNNRKNKKDHPNENFARELLELFTLGEGNYSEMDVTESARALTGWTCRKDGKFVFKKIIHGRGTKQILGHTGKFDGSDLLKILINHEQTSRYITNKIYEYLVGSKISSELLSSLSKSFRQSGFHIGTLVKKILLSEEFAFEENIGQKIKSPIELIVGLVRILNLKFSKASFLYKIQMRLGQLLLNPPNVSGWPKGKAWIDLNFIHERLVLARTLLNKDKYQLIMPMLSLEGDEGNFNIKKGKIKVDYDLDYFELNINSANDLDNICRNLYTCDFTQLSALQQKLFSDYLRGEIRVKEVLLYLFCQPEYQLC